MQVPLGRCDPRMADCRLHGSKVNATGDQERPVRVAQVVEAEWPEASRVAGPLDATAQRGAVETPSQTIGEHVVVRAREVTTLGVTVERSGGLVRERNLPRATGLGRGRFDVPADRSAHDQLRRAKSTSRQRRATSSPRRRPAYAATRTSSASW